MFSFSNHIENIKPSVIREILKHTSDPTVIPFAAGNPAVESFPVVDIQQITSQILMQNPVQALQYGISEGLSSLRESIKSTVIREENLCKSDDDLVIVSGAQQGIEIACKVFCNHNDVVICESPSFIGSLNAFRVNGAKLVGVPMQPDGISLPLLEQALHRQPLAKLIYLIPNFQNPTGQTMSLEKRYAVLALAKQYNVVILEDNPYGELRFDGEPLPSLKALDQEGRVIYCGSFSKIVSPGLRVGFVVAHQEIISKIIVCKQVEDVHTPVLSQMICDRFVREQGYDAHILRLRQLYREKAKCMIAAMEQYFPKSVTFQKPQGGMFIWCYLPNSIGVSALVKAALERGIAIVPGQAFLPDSTESCQAFRLNFSTPTKDQIQRGIAILGELIDRMH